MSDEVSDRCCMNCVYYKKRPLQQSGECQRFPPQTHAVAVRGPMGQPGVQFTSTFPTVNDGWCCGEFARELIEDTIAKLAGESDKAMEPLLKKKRTMWDAKEAEEKT